MSVPIAELLPLAIGIAASITTIITMVLMLLSPHAKSRTAGLVVGCLLGVAGTVALFALLAGQLSRQEPGASATVAAGMKTLVGVVLVVLALSQWRRRRGSSAPAELPTWMTGVDSMTTGKAFVLGLLLSAAVPKNLLLGVSAGIIVGEARLSVGWAAVAIAAFTAVAISTVAVPTVAHARHEGLVDAASRFPRRCSRWSPTSRRGAGRAPRRGLRVGAIGLAHRRRRWHCAGCPG